MKHKVNLALISLHALAVIYLLIGVAFVLFLAMTSDPDSFAFMLTIGVVTAVVCSAVAFGIEVVAYGVSRRKFWGWVAGLCVFGLFLMSIFLPLAALGLWGLLDAGSRAAFGIGQANKFCPQCGYDLRGTINANLEQCPECGTAFRLAVVGADPRP